MWLLDENISHKIKPFLIGLGFPCETVHERQWAGIRNGDLLSMAATHGFTCILTQDVKFIDSAAKAIESHPQMAVVLIRLKQQRGRKYRDTFEYHFNERPIVPTPGKLVEWP